MQEYSPPVEVSTIKTQAHQHDVHVVREDLLPGGTKQRAIIPYLQDLVADGYDEFVYASPFCGFAQVALAHAGSSLKQAVTLFCEQTPTSGESARTLHELSLLSRDLGAEIFECGSLNEAETKSRLYSEARESAYLLPLGFNHPSFLRHYAAAIEAQFTILCEKIGFRPKVLWLPVGSGTLTRVFRKVLPQDVTLKCVDVRVLKPTDERIKQIESFENTELYRSDLLFHERSDQTPPLPSNLYYDAKLWSLIERYAGQDDVWWNVAR